MLRTIFAAVLLGLALGAGMPSRHSEAQALTGESLEVAAPSSVLVGVEFPITVTAINPHGLVDTSFGDTVLFSPSGVEGMPIAYTFTPLDGGAHVFTAKLTTAGVKVWRVLDSSNPTVAPEEFVIIASDAVAFGGARTQPPAPSTGAIVMMPAPIARASAILSITAPLHVTVGTTFLVKIAVLDAAGASQLSFRDTVRLNSTGAALLPDNYSFTAADAAVHSFSVVLLSPGTHILSVQDITNSAVGQDLATVTATASSFMVSGVPVQSEFGAPAGTTLAATAICPPGRQLLAGGGSVTSDQTEGPSPKVSMSQSLPGIPNESGTAWIVVGVVQSALAPNERMSVTAHALCQT